jgi:hypothetical protein
MTHGIKKALKFVKVPSSVILNKDYQVANQFLMKMMSEMKIESQNRLSFCGNEVPVSAKRWRCCSDNIATFCGMGNPP